MLRPKYEPEDYVDEYEDAKMNEFQVQLCECLENMEVSEADTDWFQGFRDSFSFPGIADWCYDQYQSDLDTAADIAYEQMKEERWQ
jgi:hypothetical protein